MRGGKQREKHHTTDYHGNDRILTGIICGVLTYWLFAQTTYNVAPSMQSDLQLSSDTLSIAISLTALVCGITIVIIGRFADRHGRVRIALAGNALGLAGSLMLALAPNSHLLTLPLLLTARALQGLSAACIMPATLALVKQYWNGPARQRAVSLWSIGSWGGASVASFLAGLMEQTPILGWRAIFLTSAVFSTISYFVIRRCPETRATDPKNTSPDRAGLLVFTIAMIALQIWMTKGEDMGWASSTALTLLAVAVLFTTAFVYIETRPGNTHPFIDFQLFTNHTFTGCLISNMLLNGTAAGMVLVVSLVLQTAGTLTALQAGNLTIGYAVGLILFIRLGEKLLQRCGPRTAMITGCVIAAAGVAMMLPTNTLQSTYIWLTIAGFSLYGIGVGIYATPSTDTALATLPDAMGAAGSGLYKMSSTIGGAFGLALTSAVYLSIRDRGEGALWVTHLLEFAGRQDNLANREGAMLALLLNVVALLVAVISVAWAVPKEQKALT